MFKNSIIAALLVGILFQVTPYTFGAFDAIFSGLIAWAVFTFVICDTELTVKSHKASKKKVSFLNMLAMTKIK